MARRCRLCIFRSWRRRASTSSYTSAAELAANLDRVRPEGRPPERKHGRTSLQGPRIRRPRNANRISTHSILFIRVDRPERRARKGAPKHVLQPAQPVGGHSPGPQRWSPARASQVPTLTAPPEEGYSRSPARALPVALRKRPRQRRLTRTSRSRASRVPASNWRTGCRSTAERCFRKRLPVPSARAVRDLCYNVLVRGASPPGSLQRRSLCAAEDPPGSNWSALSVRTFGC